MRTLLWDVDGAVGVGSRLEPVGGRDDDDDDEEEGTAAEVVEEVDAVGGRVVTVEEEIQGVR